MTVVVPAHNEAGTIGRTVGAALAQTYPIHDVIVVENGGSTDDTQLEAILAGARVLSSPEPSKARAINLALEHVSTDLVVGVDADTELARDAVEHMAATIAVGYDGTCAAVLPKPDQPRTMTVRAREVQYTVARRWMKPVQGRLGRLHVLSGAAYCYRTQALRAVGGVPELAIGEDTNLTWTLQGAGYRLGYSPAAVAFTTEPETWREYLAQVRRWASSNFQTIARHRRQMRHPGRGLLVGASLWDLAGVSLSYALFAGVILTRPALLGLVGAWAVIMHTVIIGVSSRDLGLGRTLTSYPAFLAISWATRWIYLWTLFREWVLGRRWTAWTGRHGRHATVAPMTYERRATLAALVSAAGIAAAFAGFTQPAAAACAASALAAAGGLLWPRRQEATA